jgi:hypothetical protein
MIAIAAAVPAVALADHGNTDSVTGGGEFVPNPSQQGAGAGPGDTITFTAQQQPDPDGEFKLLTAIGQVEFIERDGFGRTRDTRTHGKVVCVHVDDRRAVIGWRGFLGNRTAPEVHHLIVLDNEEPSDDVIISDIDPEGDPCAFDTVPINTGALARGEVQIHDAE